MIGFFSFIIMDDDICLRGFFWGVLINIEFVYLFRRYKVIRWKRIELYRRIIYYIL